MNKHVFTILLAAVLLLASSAVSNADSVFGNDFLYKNTDEVVWISEGRYDGKRFVVNSPSGYIIPKEEPGAKKGVIASQGGWGANPYSAPSGELFTLINGDIIYIEAAYLHNGKYWGVMTPSHNYDFPGWILMDEILMLYEREDFEKENQNELYKYTDGFDTVLSAEKLVIWQWPGSEREKKVIDFDDLDEFDIKSISSDKAYKDQQELIWAYINIRYSYKSPTHSNIDNSPYYDNNYVNGWVCLSDPTNINIPAFNPTPNSIRWSPDGIDWFSSNNTTIWPPIDYKKLRSGNKPKNAFYNCFENKFYIKKKKMIQPLTRSRFYANGPDGYAAIRAEPGFNKEILTHWELGQFIYPNGEQLSIGYIYNLDGEYWGLLNEQYYMTGFEFTTWPYPPGWVPMDHLLIRYTSNDFLDENKGKLYTFSDDIRKAITAETFILWEWPGSDREKIICDSNVLNNIDLYLDEYDDMTKTGEYAYKDMEGREWVYIAAYRNLPLRGWVCLDDLENKEIPAFNPAPKPTKWSSDEVYDWSADTAVWPPIDLSELSRFQPKNPPAKILLPSITDTTNPLSLLLIIVIASALLIISVVLILIFRKLAKSEQGGESEKKK